MSFWQTVDFRANEQISAAERMPSQVCETYLVELNDVGVADLLEDLDLARDSLDVLLVIDLFLFENLDGNLGGFHNARTLEACSKES